MRIERAFMRSQRNGFVLIMLLVVIAIGMMIYYADLDILTGGSKGRITEKPEEQPWYHESEAAKKTKIKPANCSPI